MTAPKKRNHSFVMTPIDRPNVLQESRDALEDRGLVFDDRTCPLESAAIHVEAVTPS